MTKQRNCDGMIIIIANDNHDDQRKCDGMMMIIANDNHDDQKQKILEKGFLALGVAANC